LPTFFQSGSQAPHLPAHFLRANSSPPFLPQFSQQPVPFGVFQEKRSRPACRFGSLFQGSFIAFFRHPVHSVLKKNSSVCIIYGNLFHAQSQPSVTVNKGLHAPRHKKPACSASQRMG